METVTDEAIYKELLAGLKPIRCTIRVEPNITESQTFGLQTFFGVKVTCGSETSRAYYWTKHRGERTGPGWESALRTWRHIYRYIEDNVGAISISGGKQLAQEATYLHFDEGVIDKILEYWTDVLARHRAALFSIDRSKQFESVLQEWECQFAFDVHERLTGRAKVRIGSDARLRFSPNQMKELIEVLEDAQRLWQRARDVFWAHQNKPDWRRIVRAECSELDPLLNILDALNTIDDDLLEAIAQRDHRGEFAYRPGQVAVVSAARHVDFENKESPLGIAQYKTIERAVQKWQTRLEEAKQLNFRW